MAEPLYKRALAGREKALGAEHPDTLSSVNNLAELYRSQGLYTMLTDPESSDTEREWARAALESPWVSGGVGGSMIKTSTRVPLPLLQQRRGSKISANNRLV